MGLQNMRYLSITFSFSRRNSMPTLKMCLIEALHFRKLTCDKKMEGEKSILEIIMKSLY